MMENESSWHLFKQCIISWLHGFSTKLGNEPYLVKQYKKEQENIKEGDQRYEI
jgi:hypothetical protein